MIQISWKNIIVVLSFDIETGLYTSEHEEGKKLKLEEAVFRKYICKKSAFVIDTWKRKFCSLSEATRKNIIKDGRGWRP